MYEGLAAVEADELQPLLALGHAHGIPYWLIEYDAALMPLALLGGKSTGSTFDRVVRRAHMRVV
jgi:hypothetical protein